MYLLYNIYTNIYTTFILMFFVFIFVENLEKLKNIFKERKKMPKGGIKLKKYATKGQKMKNGLFY